MDAHGNFKWEWNSNIVYDLIYADCKKRKDKLYYHICSVCLLASQNRSSSSSSNTSRIWNWLSTAGGKFITSSYDYYKKTEIFLSLMSVDSDLYLFFR